MSRNKEYYKTRIKVAIIGAIATIVAAIAAAVIGLGEPLIEKWADSTFSSEVEATEPFTLNKDAFESLINHDIKTEPHKKNIAIVIEFGKTVLQSKNRFLGLMAVKESSAHFIYNLFAKDAFFDMGFFDLFFSGDTTLILQSGLTNKIDYFIFGKLYSVCSEKKGSYGTIFSCSIDFSYKIMRGDGSFIVIDNIHTIGPGFSEQDAVENGIENIFENKSSQIINFLMVN